MANSKDSLFLLEALVEKIKFIKAPCFSDGAFKTCVEISAPNVEPLEICDDDSGLATGGTPFVKTFNIGKSCLFFLKEKDIRAVMSQFLVNVVVFKKLPCGCLPAQIQLGKTSIDMTKEFVQARNLHLKSPGTGGFQSLQDTFRVIGEDNTDTAEIVLFLRISCFGGLIVTKFQGAANPVTLGARAVEYDRSCNPPRPYQTEEDPCVCGVYATGKKPLMGNTQVCREGGKGVCPPARDPYSVMPCAEPDEACYCTGPHPVVQTPLACRNTNPYCLHIPKGRSKQYEEIGTNLAGNELKIKVPVCSAIIKKISQTHCAVQRPYDKENKKKVVGKNDDPCEPPCGKNQISLALPSEDVCCRGSQLADTQFTCTTEGCIQAGKHSQPRSEIVHQEPPNKDVFVLKVAKTNMQGSKLSLAFSEESVKKQKRIITEHIEAVSKDLQKDNIPRIILPEETSQFDKCLVKINKQTKEIVDSCSVTSTSSSELQKPSIYFSDSVGYDLDGSCDSLSSFCLFTRKNDNTYGKVTTVFMNIWNIFGPRANSGTQATASVNKSLQVSQNNCSSVSSPRSSRKSSVCRNIDCPNKKGMGGATPTAKTNQRQINMASTFTKKPLTVVTCYKDKFESSDCESQTKKCVNIIAPNCNIPNRCLDLTGMVSHIKICQKRSECPIHPCVVSADKSDAPVKVSTHTNCRRGVFEVVIRRLNGAPLAQNELMLEWTPPPCSIPAPCASSCYQTYCYTMSSCRPSRCKLIMCKPPRCKPRCPPSQRKSPCGPIPCGPPVPWPIPCRPACSKCCQPSCRSKPCRIQRCRSPCPPPRIRSCKCSKCGSRDLCSSCSTCRRSCGKPCGIPCINPCRSCTGKTSKTTDRSLSSCPPSPCSPCVRPCPVGYRRPRKPRRVPKVKPHRKRISPCMNRSSRCPALRCLSLQTCVVPRPCTPCRPKRCKPRCCESIC